MLRESQEHLVRLLTDASARQMCARATTEKDLNDSQGGLFALYHEIPEVQLTRYAEGLLQKRWRSIKGVCPLTSALYPQLEALYTSWLSTHAAPVPEEDLSYGLTEALRALSPLRSLLQNTEAPVYASDLLAFEVLRRCSRMDRRPRFLRSTYRLDLIAKALRQGESVDTSPRPTQFRFEAERLLWKPMPSHS